MKLGPRLMIASLIVPMGVLAACGGDSDSVPSDQEVKPKKAPADWTTTDLDHVSISAPSEWTEAGTTETSETITSTTWRTEPVAGVSSAGMEVRQITKPSNNAEDAAEGLAVNAMATMDGGAPDPKQIVWPGAEDAWMYSTTISAGLENKPEQKFVSTTYVADISDELQVQVLVFTLKGEADTVGEQVLQSIELKAEEK